MVNVAPVQGADKYSWDFVRSGQEVQLSYGVPESDIVTLTFRCAAKRIEIVPIGGKGLPTD